MTQQVRARTRPVRAVTSFYGLLKDKEDTAAIFSFITAVDEPVVERIYQTFIKSEIGPQILAEKRDLANFLMDTEKLEAMPEGSFGRVYLDFMRREGLSAAGFQSEMDKAGDTFDELGEDRKRFLLRTRHAHDLYHVLTGYGRDFIGELALLGYCRQHNRSRAFFLLSYLNMIKAYVQYRGIPVLACIREGERLGAASYDLVLADWENLLPRPFEEVRRELNIGTPHLYFAHRDRSEKLDRYYRGEEMASAA